MAADASLTTQHDLSLLSPYKTFYYNSLTWVYKISGINDMNTAWAKNYNTNPFYRKGRFT